MIPDYVKANDLEILDTAGQDDFLSLRPQWMIEKDGYIFVYSMNSRHSLEELQHFFELHQQINEHREVPIVLVANKKDLCTDGRGIFLFQQQRSLFFLFFLIVIYIFETFF